MSFLNDIKSSFHDIADDLKKPLHDLRDKIEQSVGSFHASDHDDANQSDNRFRSFAPERDQNNAKWYVDGCGYMWAVSVAIQEARESIWILDWWLSPELYLRRPPSENENYRLDRLLFAAADRGVKVNIIVYKEVAAALTLNSKHTKDALEVHQNISVFRHPNHGLDSQVLSSELSSTITNLTSAPSKLCTTSSDTLKSIYGVHDDDVVLFWAHHEKLCLIDEKVAFMGGLDLCFGRWDTNNHPISDAHPSDLNNILFPGQDFNNARVLDFEDVKNFQNNKLDRTKSSRMGWSDLSICLTGPVVDDLKAHFVQRWNFIYNEKYISRNNPKYAKILYKPTTITEGFYQQNGASIPLSGDHVNTKQQNTTHGISHLDFSSGGEMFNRFRGAIPVSRKQEQYEDHQNPSLLNIQLTRSCSKWSHGIATEHSIANAYIEIIKQSQHFVYIENQFFITATGDNQLPVRNQIGAAIVERIVRAHREGQKFKVIVLMPAVPAFAGDLRAEDSLGTRAIMEFQYHSIRHNGHSIIEKIEQAGVPSAKEYIRFYNLRNYDRINTGASMTRAEQNSGVRYEDARKEHDDIVGAGFGGFGERSGARPGKENQQYDRYQQGCKQSANDSQYDSVTPCYMENSVSITEIPWTGNPEAEMDAFVSEELYIHSKLLIADDRIMICGSANLNDRSQLGYRDSEIAVIIEDPNKIESTMDGNSFQVSAFVSSLRRQLFRKHLGLIPAQDPRHQTMNFLPLTHGPNEYDWDSPADCLVRDPLSDSFTELWDKTARTNTEVFSRAFHVVPSDNCKNWEDYKNWYEKFFVSSSKGDNKKVPPKYEYGHLVKEEFPGGLREAKELLALVKGTLVEMPLDFMRDVDFAVAGVKFNALTKEIYT
ncbi:phospholipase D1 [Blumeria hordei DH14]|uniref:Phospholipase n=1 Tax=Blumeria graminis f. sp. hordei (strain DH14) TaxID=546991 RepID=N1JD41_BLUG1|nr:phospholipase D1 [Blumeria hordei DH14]